MPGFTPFTDNYSDLSDERGYQFEFRCDICGSGYRSEFQRSALGTASSLLGGASNLVSGLWGARNAADTIKDVTDRGARDAALKKVAEVGGSKGGVPLAVQRQPSRRRWLHSAPPPARAFRDSGSTRNDAIGERSMRTPPSHKAWPATAWPPPRTEISNPRSRANRSMARTSAAPVQLAMRAGHRRIAPFQIERTSS